MLNHTHTHTHTVCFGMFCFCFCFFVLVCFKTFLTTFLIILAPDLLKGQHQNLKTLSPHKCCSLHILIYSFVCFFFFFYPHIECKNSNSRDLVLLPYIPCAQSSV